MALVINTNISALKAQGNLARNQHNLDRTFSRLSSGLRINSAADDAAGLAISTRLNAQIRSLGQAQRNAADGVSLLQIMDGAGQEVGDLLVRMRELATQSMNETYSASDRGSMDLEFQQLRNEINRIAQVTEFNGINLTNATSTLTIQVGAGGSTNDQITFARVDLTASAIGIGTDNIATTLDASIALSSLDTAITSLGQRRAYVGAHINRLNSASMTISSARENLSAARSRIADADIASETAELTKNSILVQAGVSVLAQANQQPALALALLG
jgi:flagellin